MNNKNGFTLIEVLIVTAIVGILFAVALPAYQGTVKKSNRAEAKSTLMELAQRLQRCYSLYARFNDDVQCGVYADLADADGYLSQGAGFYTVTIAVAEAGADEKYTYKLTATAILAPQTDDTGCTVMTLTHTGVRTPAECW